MNIHEKNKSHRELLQEISDQLMIWSVDKTTSGYQHAPMDNLAKLILNHLKATSFWPGYDFDEH